MSYASVGWVNPYHLRGAQVKTSLLSLELMILKKSQVRHYPSFATYFSKLMYLDTGILSGRTAKLKLKTHPSSAFG